MMTTRDDNGDHMLSSEEFLTTRQVSSFFSRLVGKKRLPNVQDNDDTLVGRLVLERKKNGALYGKHNS